ncbi:MAG: DUF1353 domain-containing protein [Rhizobiaceae bacterium]
MRYPILAACLIASGCAPTSSPSSNFASVPEIATLSCTGQASSLCNFINSPVKLAEEVIELPGRDFPFNRTAEELIFIDAQNKRWVAPVGTLTDGASIPTMFVSIIGHPRSKEFINAATVHDAYCATGNESGSFYHTATWQAVHRMFYDAIIVGGVPSAKAKTMYAALYLGGPRWVGANAASQRASLKLPQSQTKLGSNNQAISEYGSSLFSTNVGKLDKPMIEFILTAAAGSGAAMRGKQINTALPQRISRTKLVAALKKAKAYIETNNPSIDQVETYLTWQETGMTGKRALKKKLEIKNKYVGAEGEGGGGHGGY